MPFEKVVSARARIRVFVDYWNFQLGFNEVETYNTKMAAIKNGTIRPEQDIPEVRVKIDWRNLGKVLAAEAASLTGNPDFSYDGMNIYASFNDKKATDKKFRDWIENSLGKHAGISVSCVARQPKRPPRCPECHKEIITCPHCALLMKATMEKGVDTLIVTDMIGLAWEQVYDIAILASADRDFIPGVNSLAKKGLKVIQVGFPPKGADLAKACWAPIDAYKLKTKITRP